MDELAKVLKKVQELNKQKKFNEVIELLTDSVLEAHNSADLYAEKANAYYMLGNYELSSEVAEKTLSIDPNHSKGLYYKAINYSDNAEYQKAIEYYNRAIASDPNDPILYTGLGNTYGNLKEFENAIKNYQKAIEIDPKYDSAYFGWGWILGEMAVGETDDERDKYLLESIEKYRKATELNPWFDAAFYNWGWAVGEIAYNSKSGEEKEKLLLESIEKYQEAIQLNPNYDAYYNWGLNLTEIAKDKTGDEKEKLLLESIEKYENSIQINPNYDAAFYGWGWSLGEIAAVKSGDEKQKLLLESIEKYEKAIELNSKIGNYYYSLGSTYFDVYQYEKALSNYKKYVEMTKRNPDYYTSVAESRIVELNKLLKDSEYSLISELVNEIKELLYYREGRITHYTGLSVAKALIIEGSLFRLSEGAFLNDTSEGRELFKFLSFDFSLSKGSDTVASPFAQKPFIGSFVAEIKHDDLTLWRMYGKEEKEEAKGCAITIDTKKLIDDLSIKMSPDKKTGVKMSADKKANMTSKTDEEFSFYRVAYRKVGEVNSFIIPGAESETEKKLNELMKQLYDAVQSFKSKKDKNSSDTLNVLELLNEIAYLFKSAEYQHEFEIRLVLKGIGFEKIINRELKPPRVYIELVGVRPLIKKITLGPKVEKPDEWASAFYYTMGKDGFAPDILISHLPFK